LQREQACFTDVVPFGSQTSSRDMVQKALPRTLGLFLIAGCVIGQKCRRQRTHVADRRQRGSADIDTMHLSIERTGQRSRNLDPMVGAVVAIDMDRRPTVRIAGGFDLLGERGHCLLHSLTYPEDGETTASGAI
jgi:hypothetical protein